MRLRTQLHLCAAIAFAAITAVGVGLGVVTRQGERIALQERSTQEVARHVSGLLTLTHEYTLYLGERPVMQWQLRHRLLLAALDAAVASEQPASDPLVALRGRAGDVKRLFDQVLGLDGDRGDPAFAERRRKLLLERLLIEMQELVELRYQWAREVGERGEAQRATLGALVVAGPASLLLLLALLVGQVGRRVLAPLQRLQRVSVAIEGGDAGARFGSARADELGDTGRAVDRMADTLVAAQQRLRLIIDHVPALIAHLDGQRRYTLVNAAYERWEGRSAADLVGRSVVEVRGAVNHAVLQPWLDRAYAGEQVTFEVALTMGDAPRSLQVSYVPARDEQGRVTGIYVMKTDVTPVRRAEERLRRVMDSSPLGMFLRGVDGSLLYANPAWRRMVGRDDPGDAPALVDAVHPDDRALIARRWQEVLAGADVSFAEFRYLRPDGAVVWARGHLQLLRRGGVAEAVVGMAEDVTERRTLDAALAAQAQALARSNEDLERFAYVASHDLQEPLRMVTSYGQLLLRRHAARLDDDGREFLAFMVEGGTRAQALIRDLLALARLDSQARPHQAVALADVLAASLAELRQRVHDSGARIDAGPLPRVYGDARQLGQLFTNLIGNALKFAGDRPPQVEISAQAEGACWRVEVRDHGIGIEPRFFDRIFVMFQRLHLRSQHPGTGIGLAICKRVVERHGGRIGVTATPGQGSTFFFTLPAFAPAAGAAVATAASGASGASGATAATPADSAAQAG